MKVGNILIQMGKKNIIWIDGWAVPLQIWDDKFSLLYPNYLHLYLESSALLGSEITKGLSDYLCAFDTNDTIIAAWSLGSHLWLKYLMQNPNCQFKSLILCPIFCFCSSANPLSGPWPKRVLNKMILELQDNPKKLLTNFWYKCLQDHLDKELTLLKLKSLYRIPPTTVLQKGLECLAQSELDFKNLSHLKSSCHLFIGSKFDPICPFNPDRDPLFTLKYQLYEKGHFPFFDFPKLIKEGLNFLF